MTTSAYISIFDDWNLLKVSIDSIIDFVDNIIIVDGAYKWMEPFLLAGGRDPSRSVSEVYDVLSDYGRKVRVVGGLWANESAKRRTGYEACTGRYVLRSDADEVLFWNPEQVETFLASDFAVGEMEMPIYVAPGLIRRQQNSTAIERQAFFFDGNKISSAQHLAYLWLVLPPAEAQALLPRDNAAVFPEPLAFNAHLTHWRRPQTAASRARFYILNYVRGARQLPWLPSFTFDGDESLARIPELVPPRALTDVFLGDKIVACPPDMEGMWLAKSPCSPEQEGLFIHLYDAMLTDLAVLNESLAYMPRHLPSGFDYNFDITTGAALNALGSDRTVRLTFSRPLLSAKVKVTSLLLDGSTRVSQRVAEIDGLSLQVALDADESTPAWLRRTLSLSIWTDSNPEMLTMLRTS